MMEPMEEEELTGAPIISPVERQVMDMANNERTQFGAGTEDIKSDPLWKIIIQHGTFHAIIFLIFFVIAIPTLIFFFVIENDPPLRLGASSCSVDPGYRVSCGHANISRSYCLSIRCCHDETREECYHFIPSKYGYTTGSEAEVTPGSGGTGGRFLATPKYTTLGSRSVPELKLTVQEIDENRVRIILHAPEDNVVENAITGPKGYGIGFYGDFLGIEIHRSDEPQDLLLTTALGPLMASEPYWEWTFQLTSTHLFGLGGLLIEPNATVHQIFYPNRFNHVMQQPIFLAHTKHQWHSVLVNWVGGPLEVIVLPSRLVVLRILGGGRIELTLGVGPDPKNAANQMKFTGEDMVVPPRWMLGLHMCRDGVTTLQKALSEYVKFHLRERVLKFETDCIHENLFIMLANDNSIANVMEDLEKALQPQAINNILLSIPPQVPVGSTLFNEANALDILYKHSMQDEYINASYNGLNVAYPQYDSESIGNYMLNVQNIMNAISKKGRIVGIVLRDNWPDADNIFYEDEEQLPYMTDGLIEALSYTLPYNSTTTIITTPHYLSHRSYATSHLSAIKTLELPPSIDPPIYISPTLDHPTQAHSLYMHLQHVNATWEELRRVMHYSIYHSIFGIGGTGLVTAPVCGSGELWNAEIQEELCIRWWLYAATTALVRVSSGGLRRDPESLPYKTSQSLVLRALTHRTTLLPYYYTTLAQREPLLRPLFFDYPADVNTYALDEQYLVGDALLVAQPLTPNMVVQRVYLPRREECGGWYEYWEGTHYDVVEEKPKRKRNTSETTEGLWVEIPLIASDWVMFIASGKIIPRAKESSDDTFSLLLATGKASCSIIEGEMFFKTQSLYFKADQNNLTISNILAVKGDVCVGESSTSFHNIDYIYVYGRAAGNIQISNVLKDLCAHLDDVLNININNGPISP